MRSAVAFARLPKLNEKKDTNRKISRRKFIAAGAAVVAAAAVAGGVDYYVSTPTAPTNSTATSSLASSSTVSPRALVDILENDGPRWSRALAGVIENIELKDPALNVYVDPYPPSDGEKAKAAVELSSHSSTYSMIRTFWGEQTAEVVNGWIEPWDAWIEKYNAQWILDDIFPVYITAGQYMYNMPSEYQNKQWILPSDAATCLCYYRTDLLEKYGITTNDIDTLDGLVQAADTIQTGEKGAVYGLGLWPEKGNESYQCFNWFLWQLYGYPKEGVDQPYGAGALYQNDWTPRPASIFSGVIAYAKNLMDKYAPPDVQTYNEGNFPSYWSKGNMAIVPYFTVNTALVSPTDNPNYYNVTGVKGPSAGPGGRYTMLFGGGWVLNVNSKVKDETMQFVTEFYKPDNADAFVLGIPGQLATTGTGNPASRSWYTSEIMAQLPIYGAMKDALPFAVTDSYVPANPQMHEAVSVLRSPGFFRRIDS